MLIWMLSARGASGQDSGHLLAWGLARVGLPLPRDPYEAHLLHVVARKAAHVCAFAVVALLALRATGGRLQLAWVWAVAWAMVDEWHQTFVPGRGGAWRDVLIDAFGASWALWIAWAYKIGGGRLGRRVGLPSAQGVGRP